MPAPSRLPQKSAPPRRERQVVAVCLAIVAGMTGLSYASPSLYDLFCRVTGYGGTPQRASANAGPVLDRSMTVRFDANVAPGMDWEFRPVQGPMDVRIGETVLAFYEAHNPASRVRHGTAAFNVTPAAAAVYVRKIECFCFTEQSLQPGQTAQMPVTFYLDPAITADPLMAAVNAVTFSYTFYHVDRQG